MKLMFASDIHGSAYYAKRLREIYKKENPDKLILLGDLLYHGPRNELPREYSPKEVISVLNSMSDSILAVRGNCDSEVDQMVLNFPIMADYAVLYIDGHMCYLTHGHKINTDSLIPLSCGDILIHGHTHIQAMQKQGHITYINPGSVSIPKEGNLPSFMLYENEKFTIYSMDGEFISELKI